MAADPPRQVEKRKAFLPDGQDFLLRSGYRSLRSEEGSSPLHSLAPQDQVPSGSRGGDDGRPAERAYPLQWEERRRQLAVRGSGLAIDDRANEHDTVTDQPGEVRQNDRQGACGDPVE